MRNKIALTFSLFIFSFCIGSLKAQEYSNQLIVHYKGEQKVFTIEEVDSITFRLNATSPIQNEPSLFVGGDISMLPSYEANGNQYYDSDGSSVELLPYLKNLGWNSMRVRLFVDPSNATEANKGEGVIQDLNYVLKLGKRIKEAGFKFLLDFHYSDTWADPQQQTTPASWSNASATALCDTLYNYTKRCLTACVNNNATPDFIQIGNEISYGMLWPTGKVYATSDDNWTVFSNFLKAASKACREVCPNAEIVVHTERSGNANVSYQYYKKLENYGVDYDIIGLSYYPFWHNDIATLSNTLSTLENNFPSKKIQIVETAYYYQWQPEVNYDFSSQWSISPEGQEQFLIDLIAELRTHKNVNGLYWWFPEENGNGVIDNWVNRGLFDDNNGKALPALFVLSDFAK